MLGSNVDAIKLALVSFFTPAGSAQADMGRTSSRSTMIGAVFLLLIVAPLIWITHFLYAAEFGLYEDDWYRVPKVIGIHGHDLWMLIQNVSQLRPSQGRPLHPALIELFSYFGFRLGGLEQIYVIGFVILLANASLFYALLRRVVPDGRTAVLATLAFSLFPADTTQPFLTHALGVQPAITLLLIALHAYISDWKLSAYAVILVSLFTYEPAFLVFFAAPLMRRGRLSELVKHCVILVVLLACAFLFRSATAESRAAHIGAWDMALGLVNVVAGPLTCLAMYVYRPIETLFKTTTPSALILLPCFAVLACVVALQVRPEGDSCPVAEACDTQRGGEYGWDRWRPVFIGALMLLAAYPLTLTTTGIAVAGRGTRVHTAAILGASVLCACVCLAILDRPTSTRGKFAALFGVAGFFTLLSGFGLTVQHDYVVGWQEQRAFWTDLVRLCPDLDDGTVIFVDPTGLRDTRQLAFLRKDPDGVPETRQIKSLDIMYDVLQELYDFPATWQNPPRVYRLPLDWQQQIFAGDNRLRILTIEAGYSYFPGPRTTVPSTDAIVLDTSAGRLARLQFLVDPETGQRLPLKSDPGVPAHLDKANIYPDVILQPEQKRIRYLVQR